MTTQLPYEPPQYGAYPTTPPWAAAPPNATPAPGRQNATAMQGSPDATSVPERRNATPVRGAHCAGADAFIPASFTEALPPRAERAAPPSALSLPFGRGVPPSVLPIALLTCLFNAFGAIAAIRQANAAARDGHPRRPYWITFAIGMVANTFILTSIMTVLLPQALP